MDTDDAQPPELGPATKVIFSIVLACCVLVPAELLLQLHYYTSVGESLLVRGVPAFFETDDVRCYRLKPNMSHPHNTTEFETVVYTNERGLRTTADHRSLPFEKPEDVYRIVFLGPSMTFGWGVDFEATYPSLISNALAVADKRVEFVNAGTPAQSLGDQTCWLRADGHRYTPDLVVSTRVGPNLKIKNGCRAEGSCSVVDEAGRLASEVPTAFSRFQTFVKKSGLVFYAYNLYIESMARSEADVARDFGWEPIDPDSPADADGSRAANSFYEHVVEVQAVLGRNVPVAFIVVPASFEVHPADLARWSHQLSIDPREIEQSTAHTIAQLEDREQVVSYALESLRNKGQSERAYFLLDSHLTVSGHRIVADHATEVIQSTIDRIALAANASSGLGQIR